MIDEQLNMYLELSRYAGKPRGTVLYSGQSTAAIHLVAARFRVGRTLWCVYRNLVVSCGVPLVSLVTIVTCAGWACASVSSVHDRTLKKPRRDVQAARPPDPRPDVSGDHAKTVLKYRRRERSSAGAVARCSHGCWRVRLLFSSHWRQSSLYINNRQPDGTKNVENKQSTNKQTRPSGDA